MTHKYLTSKAGAPTTYATYQNSGKPVTSVPVNLRGLYGAIEDQGAEGACTAFAALQFRAALRRQAGLPWIAPSEQAQYYEERALEGTINQDNGATLEEALHVLEQYGVMPSEDDPYTEQDFMVNPPAGDWNASLRLNPAQAQRIETTEVNGVQPPLLADTLDALSNGHPVYFAYDVFQEMESEQVAETGVLTMPQPNGQCLGGHAVNAIGFDPAKQMILVLNQWGEDWGIKSPEELKGCFWMPYEYYERYCTGAYVGFPDAVSGQKAAVDCSARLTPTTTAGLKAAGVVAVGRYLGFKTQGWSKCLTPDELQAIHAAGLSVVLIWESDPTSEGYFNYAKGVADAKLAVEEAAYLGVPKGTAIYFTADYDAQPSDMPVIISYFEGVRAGLAGQYLVGAYGSYSVLEALKASSYAPDKYWQTSAWSKGQIFPDSHIYQYQNNATLAGVAVDRDTIQNDAGAWPEIGGEDLKNLVIYKDGDVGTALLLSYKLECPMVLQGFEPRITAENKHWVGISGTNGNGNYYYAGGDRVATAEAAL